MMQVTINSNFSQPKFPKNNTNTKKHSSKKHTNVSSDLIQTQNWM